MASALERAAGALCTSIAGESRWERLSDSARSSYRKHARAVLMAVREPDRGMIIAGNDKDGYYNDGTPFNAECSQHWRAMIDAILNEKDTTND